MRVELLKKIICLENFIIENKIKIDGEGMYIRPLYLELLALSPDIQMELAAEISKQIKKYHPQVLYAIESAILPLATLIAEKLNIPLSIVRKPRNYKHEDAEPTIFIREELKSLPSVLIDDAIWSGYTMHHIFKEFVRQNIKLPFCYFVFNFLDFCKGGAYLTEVQQKFLQNSDYWVNYREIVIIAHDFGLVSDLAYENTIQMFSL